MLLWAGLAGIVYGAGVWVVLALVESVGVYCSDSTCALRRFPRLPGSFRLSVTECRQVGWGDYGDF